MTGLIPVTEELDTEQERWTKALHLVGQWLLEFSGHSRATYADAIGWPYRVNGEHAGEWRGYLTRHGLTWLAWCHSHGVHLFDAKRVHILAWIDTFTPSDVLSKRSRAQLVSAASSFYIWAGYEGHTEHNPVSLINRKKKNLRTGGDKSPTRSLSKAEAKALIAAADRDPVQGVRLRTSAMISTLFRTGARVGEICNAKLSDMRIQDGLRTLHVAIKGGKEHDYALAPEVCRRIDAYLASRDDINRLPVRRVQGAGANVPLFATSTGTHMRRQEMLTLVKRIAKLADLDDPGSIHPHVARHTFITEARRQGYVGEDIQHAVGHTQIATTDKYGKHIISLEKSPAYGVAAAFEPD